MTTSKPSTLPDDHLVPLQEPWVALLSQDMGINNRGLPSLSSSTPTTHDLPALHQLDLNWSASGVHAMLQQPHQQGSCKNIHPPAPASLPTSDPWFMNAVTIASTPDARVDTVLTNTPPPNIMASWSASNLLFATHLTVTDAPWAQLCSSTSAGATHHTTLTLPAGQIHPHQAALFASTSFSCAADPTSVQHHLTCTHMGNHTLLGPSSGFPGLTPQDFAAAHAPSTTPFLAEIAPSHSTVTSSHHSFLPGDHVLPHQQPYAQQGGQTGSSMPLQALW